MKYSTVITGRLNATLLSHLHREDGQEDVCFATYLPSTGQNRYTGILQTIILPLEGERDIHGNVSFNDNYVERALLVAADRKEGLALLHSHPKSEGWQGMSPDDITAETKLAPSVLAMTEYPLLGLTVASNGDWCSRFWIKNPNKKRKFDRNWSESVRVFGDNVIVNFNSDEIIARTDSKKQLRTISAWGIKTQKNISRLRIGIVGLGSVGSIVAEILARTGFTNFTLIDFDAIEEKNLDRLTNVFKKDIGKAKVQIIGKAMQQSASAGRIILNANEYSICEEKGYKDALDCDILFSCVDRPWPRQILNYIAYAHLIPVIDGGIAVRTNDCNTSLTGADWKVQTVGYGRPCMECLGQFSSGDAKLEIDGLLDKPQYINQLSKADRKRVDAHENVYAFSSYVASMEVIQLLTLLVAPEGFGKIGQHTYHMIPGEMEVDMDTQCHEKCYYQKIMGRADLAGAIVFSKHTVAELARASRKKSFKEKLSLFFNL
jgi:hypothetical protein